MKTMVATATRGILGCLLLFAGLSGPSAQAAEPYADSWGPAVGATLPVLDAPDHTGRERSLENLAGDQGLLLFLVRSADW